VLSIFYSSLHYFVSHRYVVKPRIPEIEDDDKNFFDQIAASLTNPREKEKSSDIYIESSFSGDNSDESTSFETGTEKLPYSYAKFHTVFALAILYIGTVHINVNEEEISSVTTGVTGHWIKYAIFLVTMALYIWSLVAPFVLKNGKYSNLDVSGSGSNVYGTIGDDSLSSKSYQEKI